MKLLKELSEAAGVSGAEGKIREIIKRELKGKVDEIREDAMGNLIALKKGKAKNPKKIMIAAHMDEIGFFVRYIDDKGFLKINAAGGFDTRNLFSRRVIVHSSGKELHGLIEPAGKPIHMSTPEERGKYLDINDFVVDLGMKAEKVKELVSIGDMVTLDAHFIELGDLWCGKAMDDRAAVWTGIRVMQQLKQPKNDIYAVFTVQEEVGLRGATTSAFGIAPDVGIAIDVTLACDTPGVPDDLKISELGKGVSISVMNSAVISDRDLVTDFINLAKKEKITYQVDILPRGGTDAGAMQRAGAGCKAITVSIPCRWVHTTTECVHPDDMKSCVALVKAYCEK